MQSNNTVSSVVMMSWPGADGADGNQIECTQVLLLSHTHTETRRHADTQNCGHKDIYIRAYAYTQAGIPSVHSTYHYVLHRPYRAVEIEGELASPLFRVARGDDADDAVPMRGSSHAIIICGVLGTITIGLTTASTTTTAAALDRVGWRKEMVDQVFEVSCQFE